MEEKNKYPFVEPEDSIYICMIDTSYTQPHEDDEAELRASKALRKQLSEEFGRTFYEANIGMSADLPAFLTILENRKFLAVLGGALALFLAGKPINSNIEAWVSIAKKIRKFFKKNVVLSRNGAAIIAFEAVVKKINEPVDQLILLGYELAPYGVSDNLEKNEQLESISASPDILYIGFSTHVFDIRANGAVYRVIVRGEDITLMTL